MSPMLGEWSYGSSQVLNSLPGLTTQVQRAFTESAYRALRGVRCELVQPGVLKLLGTVPTYFHRQMAQSIAQKLAGVEVVVDRIEVQAYAKPR